MKKSFLPVLLCGVLLLGASSCSDNDGDWTPMKWKTSVVTEKNGKIQVPAQGGSYVFMCTNYGKPWMSSLCEKTDGKDVYYQPQGQDTRTITSPWLEAGWTDNVLTVTVSPNTTGRKREMDVQVTAGDIFHTFSFVQQAAE